MEKIGLKYFLYAFAISTVFGTTGITVAHIDSTAYSMLASFIGNSIGYYLLHRFAKFVFNINMQNNE